MNELGQWWLCELQQSRPHSTSEQKHGCSPSLLSSQPCAFSSGSQSWPRDTAGVGLLRNTNSSLAKWTQYKKTTFSCRHDQFSCKKIIWKYVKKMIPWTFTFIFPLLTTWLCLSLPGKQLCIVIFSRRGEEKDAVLFTVYTIFYILCRESQNDKIHWLRFWIYWKLYLKYFVTPTRVIYRILMSSAWMEKMIISLETREIRQLFYFVVAVSKYKQEIFVGVKVP